MKAETRNSLRVSQARGDLALTRLTTQIGDHDGNNDNREPGTVRPGLGDRNRLPGPAHHIEDRIVSNVIQIDIRNVYGKQTAYPANSEAGFFAEIAGDRTLTPHTIINAAALGFQVQVKEPISGVFFNKPFESVVAHLRGITDTEES